MGADNRAKVSQIQRIYESPIAFPAQLYSITVLGKSKHNVVLLYQ
jgi:hypothetical protein